MKMMKWLNALWSRARSLFGTRVMQRHTLHVDGVLKKKVVRDTAGCDPDTTERELDRVQRKLEKERVRMERESGIEPLRWPKPKWRRSKA